MRLTLHLVASTGIPKEPYLLAYSKTSETVLRGRSRDESKYSNPDNDPRGVWMSRSILGLASPEQRPNLHYSITDPDSGINYAPPANTGWRYAKERMQELIGTGCILFPKKPDGRPREKKFRADLESEFTSFPTLIDDVFTSHGTTSIRSLFENQLFDFPKPPELIHKLVEQAAANQDIVLDFFAGSGTTAHAVMALNAEDGGNRKFIMVQLPEPTDKPDYPTIADIGKERIRRAGEKILADKGGIINLDVGFKVFKLDSTNIKPWDVGFDDLETSLPLFADSLKDDRSNDDVLYEILLKYGHDLSLPITTHTLAGKTAYSIGGGLVVCLDKNITLDVVEAIVELKKAFALSGELDQEMSKSMRVVFRDSGFADDVVKVNAVQILKQAGIEDVRSV
ncbi:site-specific DNA-methyltransferase [Thiothrix lacustris]|uniref:site-specific DNA-methyltransferase n=1 Tax=Thiothrix lacustris TaxID=525917 RepID=UPI0027E3B439|nr:DNA methyltransferase [Thiothrix lacustris]WMP15752.1 DNA methyltransferase [Thiothrix lacustris]